MWDPAVIQLIGTLGGSLGGVLIGALVTWLSLRAQYRIKAMELQETTRLRGKELLFQTYQAKVGRVSDELKSLGAGVGGILGLYAGGDDEERKKLNATFFGVAKETVPSVRERFEDLEEARKKVGLAGACPIQMQAARDFLNQDLSGEKTQEEIQRILIDYVKTTATIPSLWEDVLEVKSEAIFGDDAKAT